MSPYPGAVLFHTEARIISLLGLIGDIEVNQVVDLMLRLDVESTKEITIYVSAQGGNMIESLKLLDTLQLMRATILVVAFGLVEGAGLILLAAAHRRIVFPSLLLSTGGLWKLPEMHDDNRPTIGLHNRTDNRERLLSILRKQAEQAFTNTPHKILPRLADPSQGPQLFTATESIDLGLADAVITGPHRRLLKLPVNTTSSRATSVRHL